VVIGADYTGSYKSNNYAIKTTTAPHDFCFISAIIDAMSSVRAVICMVQIVVSFFDSKKYAKQIWVEIKP
jgi:hypothetical protein